jgi:hypothetical protein
MLESKMVGGVWLGGRGGGGVKKTRLPGVSVISIWKLVNSNVYKTKMCKY